MGVIRWDKVGGNSHYVIFGDLGGEHICSIWPQELPFNGQSVDGFRLVFHDQFPGNNGDGTYSDFASVGLEAAKGVAEEFLGLWLEKVGLVPKSVCDDLQAENAVLKERISSAFGDIDDAITALKRKVDDIVADTGVDRTWSWDVPVDEWWKGAKGERA